MKASSAPASLHPALRLYLIGIVTPYFFGVVCCVYPYAEGEAWCEVVPTDSNAWEVIRRLALEAVSLVVVGYGNGGPLLG